MPFNFGIATNPNTRERVLVLATQPEPFDAKQVLQLLRMLKKHFPEYYNTVQMELIVPEGTNGRLSG